jgi:cytochrome c5
MKKIFLIAICIICCNSHAQSLGKTTYKISCSNCHSPKLAKSIGAPEAFNKKYWRARFKNARLCSKKQPDKYKSELDYLLQHVKQGKGLMYHGGLCNEAQVKNKDCSDEALIAAIQYMSENKKE